MNSPSVEQEHANPSDVMTIVFDSDCILCSHWVKFIMEHEASDSIRFASSRKANGIALAERFGLTAADLDMTYLVVHKDCAYTKSAATLRVVSQFKRPWSWLKAFIILPRFLRDAVYDLVAKNRLKWFGMQKDCFLPPHDQRHRFLD